jgi:hypothetical protein
MCSTPEIPETIFAVKTRPAILARSAERGNAEMDRLEVSVGVGSVHAWNWLILLVQ